MTYQIAVSCTNIKCYLLEICNNIKREMLHAKTENNTEKTEKTNNQCHMLCTTQIHFEPDKKG